ncbi:integral membrane protein [Histoplasma capsulatum G186AR]|uniref:Integral membrane protein n=1 Tax=Ajellomyces capsulatus TaxID=5037 RepID=A0A8H7YNE8_AJECA|nr:integral membrane protein [Histoplasma capsulatum]QSS74563.1 integral membrane protein [Histoplasma capsulatum G186AR]
MRTASLPLESLLIVKHPLQRLHSPSRGFSAILHLAALSSFAFSFKYIIDHPNLASEAYGWHFQYLTIIGLCMATLTNLVGLAADVFLSIRLFAVKNVLLVCSAPMEVLISVLYWGLKIIDAKLVRPDWVELSTEADIGFHAIPAIVLAIDLLYLSPPWSIGAIPSMGLASIIAFGYWFWVEKCYQYNGWYPYPIFEMLTTGWRINLFLFSAILMTINTLLLKHLYGRMNGFLHPISGTHPGDLKKA